MNLRTLFLGAALIAFSASSLGQEIELDSGLPPNTTRLLSSEDQGQATISVVEDRGLVAKSLIRGVVFPVSVNKTKRFTIKQTSGARSADGSLPITLEVLDQEVLVRDTQGNERTVPNAARLKGVTISAVFESDGHLRPNSLQLRGATEEDLKLVRPMLIAMFEQIKGDSPARLQIGVPSTQETKMSLPIANLATFDMVGSTTYTLQRVEQGVAEIDTKESLESMSFGQPPMRMSGSGVGAGSMRYAIEAKRIDSSVDRLEFSFNVETPEGTLRIQSHMVSTMNIKDVASADQSVSPIVGSWSLTGDNCTDTYTYRVDGVFSSTSGQEALEGTYTTEVVSTSNPTVIKVVRTISKDKLGRDCTGSSIDFSGKSDTRYVKFNSAGTEMLVCSTLAANNCIGPLLRIGN